MRRACFSEAELFTAVVAAGGLVCLHFVHGGDM